ncbi:MAG: DnaA regulatory inactivator Hda [Porticoccaceae bacterium]|nr:MAG: DnaA regulatory inactivator Hda [Porticoccaceae bacterium]
MTGQLPLAVALREEATFANFLVTDAVRGQAVAALCGGLAGGGLVYLWGKAGAGASHLAQATCHEARGGHQWLPLAELGGCDPAALTEGLEALAVVALDDLQLAAGDGAWERALFALHNGLQRRGGLLVVTADRPPRALPLGLPDLASRLAAGLVFHLPAYGDEAKRAVLCFRARRRGLELSEEAADWLLRRHSRHLVDLLALLDWLDLEALRHQRRLTVPFLRALLAQRAAQGKQ